MDIPQQNEKKCTSEVSTVKKKERKFWQIDKEMFRFKLHFFLIEGALGASVPFISVLAKDRIGFSATSMAALNVTQRFIYMFSKPLIGYLADYFHKLKEIICILIVIQGLFFFLLLAIPHTGRDTTQWFQTFEVQSFHEKVNISVSREKCRNLYDSEAEILMLNASENSLVCSFAQNVTDISLKEEINYFRLETLNLSSIENASSNITLKNCDETNSVRNISNKQNTFYFLEHRYFKNPNSSMSVVFCVICKSLDGCCSLSCTNVTETNLDVIEKSDFRSYQYWVFAVFSITAFASMNALFTLSDTACFETIQKTGADFGKQRLWSAVGWGAVSPLGGLLADFTNDYITSFAFSSVMWVVSLWNILKLELIQPHFSKNILRDVGTVFRSGEFLAFQTGVLLHGISMGFVWFYLIWFLSDIGGSRFLCGFSQFMQSFIGDIPFMFCSTWVINKLGHFNVLSLALLTDFIRFLAYSYLANPWYIIPVECLHGLTYGIFIPAIASYAKMNAKPGTEATTQAILFATHEGLGAGIGNILAGTGFDYLGGHQTYFYASMFAGCSTIVSVVFTLCIRIRKRNFKVSSSVDVKASSEDVKASSEDVKASSEDVKASSEDVKASSEDVKASSEDVKASSENVTHS